MLVPGPGIVHQTRTNNYGRTRLAHIVGSFALMTPDWINYAITPNNLGNAGPRPWHCAQNSDEQIWKDLPGPNCWELFALLIPDLINDAMTPISLGQAGPRPGHCAQNSNEQVWKDPPGPDCWEFLHC